MTAALEEVMLTPCFAQVVGLPLRATLGVVEKVVEQGEREDVVDEFEDGEG